MCFECTLKSDGTVRIDRYTGTDICVRVPDTIGGHPVSEIGDRAFCGNKHALGVIVPESVWKIGDHAFAWGRLRYAILRGAIEIGDFAFYMNKLRGVSMPHVETIGNSAFSGNELPNIAPSENLRSIGVGAFRYNKVETLQVPESVRKIGNNAFQSNHLRLISVFSSTAVGRGAFADNPLDDVKVIGSMAAIEEWLFDENSELESAAAKVVVSNPSAKFELRWPKSPKKSQRLKAWLRMNQLLGPGDVLKPMGEPAVMVEQEKDEEENSLPLLH